MSYVTVLEALKALPFNVGRKTLIGFLLGDVGIGSVSRNGLDEVEFFGSLKGDSFEEIEGMVDNLISNGLIDVKGMEGNKFAKLLELNSKGNREIAEPTLFKRKVGFGFIEKETLISERDKEVFKEFGEILDGYNDEQKKAVISPSEKVLCVAGAGSGKTTVLVKRIEFLVKYRGVEPRKILAITFTRKARKEMMDRIEKIGFLEGVRIETFNSFCEKFLRDNGNLVYGRSVRVINYGDKLVILRRALESIGLDMVRAIRVYFGESKQVNKTDEQLASIFLNDCFFIRDYFKFKNKVISESDFEFDDEGHRKCVRMVVDICGFIERAMSEGGLRDFADQMIDSLSFFERRKDLIPSFEHVLVDEYQDVNSTQVKFIEYLAPKNLFCVGDPRQSIYGWRGSDIKYILNFESLHPGCEVVNLKKNYRSSKKIINLINDSIRDMKFVDLEIGNEDLNSLDYDVRIMKFGSEVEEFGFVIDGILSSGLPGKEIFVLARTNNQLAELSKVLRARGIKHVVRSDEVRKSVDAVGDEVTLATIHAIKGLEAEMVFVIGCTMGNFPAKGSEHPIIDMLKLREYDKEEEEKRLFYVAMSRAKQKLFLSYYRKPTYFIKDSMVEIVSGRKVEKLVDSSLVSSSVGSSSSSSSSSVGSVRKKVELDLEGVDKDLFLELKGWRKEVADEEGVPAYCVFHNSTLAEIARSRPRDFSELMKIDKVGMGKIEKYGSAVLRIVGD